AGARSFVPTRTFASSVPIAGASSAIAPIVAIHPPGTAPHAVPAGRTSAVRAMSSPSHIVGLRTQSPLSSGARPRPSRRPCRELSERCLCPCGLREFFGEVRALPGKFRAAEVTVRRRREIDRSAQREPIDDGLRTEIEMLLDELADELVAHLARPERLHVERDRTRAADHVRDLHLETIGEPRLHHVLRDVAKGVGRGTVDLRWILARERATAMAGVAAVGVDDDLAAREAGVSHRSAD